MFNSNEGKPLQKSWKAPESSKKLYPGSSKIYCNKIAARKKASEKCCQRKFRKFRWKIRVEIDFISFYGVKVVFDFKVKQKMI